jgi:hypothetical protein
MSEDDFQTRKDPVFVGSRVLELWQLDQQAQADAEMYSAAHYFEQESWVDYRTVNLERVCLT